METGLRTAPRAEEEKDPPAQRKLSTAGGGDLGPECCKCNGLINTRSVMVETKEGRVSVYSAQQYQGHMVINYSPERAGQDRNGTHISGHHPQLLNPSALPQALEPFYKPNLILYPERGLRVWGEGSDCCETTFIEDMAPANSTATGIKDGLMLTDNKFLDLSIEDTKVHTLSGDVDDEDEFQELEVGFGHLS